MPSAVFIDRDDTLVDTRGATAATDHVGDLIDPAAVRLLPGALQGCRALHDAGFTLVLVSNQGCVARGRATLRQVEAVNDRVRELLAEAGVHLRGVYYCPHHPDAAVPALKADHPWRKPQPGMYMAAAAELDISLKDSWAIGDAARDVLSAVTAGLEPGHAIVIGKGPGIWHADLKAATDAIVKKPGVQP